MSDKQSVFTVWQYSVIFFTGHWRQMDKTPQGGHAYLCLWIQKVKKESVHFFAKRKSKTRQWSSVVDLKCIININIQHMLQDSICQNLCQHFDIMPLCALLTDWLIHSSLKNTFIPEKIVNKWITGFSSPENSHSSNVSKYFN